MSIRSKMVQELKNDPSKQRTRMDVDKDYSYNAIQYGHKARIVEALQCEMKEHLVKLKELNAEGMRLPPEPAPAEVKLNESEGAPSADQAQE